MKNKYIDLVEQSFDFPQEEFKVEDGELYFHNIPMMDIIEQYGTPLKITYLPKISSQIQKAKRQDYFNICTTLGVNALYAGHLHNNSEGSYEGLPVSTTTSVAFQIGPAQPSIRVIKVQNGMVSDELLNL